MRFVERFIKGRQEREGQTPKADPLARRINQETHQMRFYPGFSEFVEAWNQYLDSKERRELREWVRQLEGAKLIVDEPKDIAGEHLATIQSANEMLSKEDISKAEAKRLRRIRRRASEKIARLNMAEGESETPDTLDARSERLKDADRSFVAGLEDHSACQFYALEFFLGDQQEVDKIFIERVVGQDNTQYKKELDLWGLNFSFLHKAEKYYRSSSETMEKPELDARLKSDTRRQAFAAFGSSQRYVE